MLTTPIPAVAQASTSEETHCSHVANCELFPVFKRRASLAVWQTFYCHGRFSTCARYKLSLEGKPVSPGLLPNGKELNLAGLGL